MPELTPAGSLRILLDEDGDIWVSRDGSDRFTYISPYDSARPPLPVWTEAELARCGKLHEAEWRSYNA